MRLARLIALIILLLGTIVLSGCSLHGSWGVGTHIGYHHSVVCP